MGLYVLELALWMLGIRGHIPQYGDYHPIPAASSPRGSGTRLALILAVFVVVFAVLAMMVWVAVWLAITLL